MQRFWSKVQKTNTCWNWTAFVNHNGYGRFSFKSKPMHAHRFSWELHNGPIPDGLNVLHRCDNPKCVNPSHLFLGTQKDNVKDMVKKNRQSNKMGRKGESHSQNKLNEANIKRIRELYLKSFTQKELAKLFKVSQSQISRIVNNKNWGHI